MIPEEQSAMVRAAMRRPIPGAAVPVMAGVASGRLSPITRQEALALPPETLALPPVVPPSAPEALASPLEVRASPPGVLALGPEALPLPPRTAKSIAVGTGAAGNGGGDGAASAAELKPPRPLIRC
jgi:hypothetical protein